MKSKPPMDPIDWDESSVIGSFQTQKGSKWMQILRSV